MPPVVPHSISPLPLDKQPHHLPNLSCLCIWLSVHPRLSPQWIDYRYDSDGEEVGVAVRPGARAGEVAAAGPSNAYSAEGGFQVRG